MCVFFFEQVEDDFLIFVGASAALWRSLLVRHNAEWFSLAFQFYFLDYRQWGKVQLWIFSFFFLWNPSLHFLMIKGCFLTSIQVVLHSWNMIKIGYALSISSADMPPPFLVITWVAAPACEEEGIPCECCQGYIAKLTSVDKPFPLTESSLLVFQLDSLSSNNSLLQLSHPRPTPIITTSQNLFQSVNSLIPLLPLLC